MLAYMCSHSGLYYPEAYVKEWGRNGYGVGLGDRPVSECLDSDYNAQLAVPDQDAAKAMHPVGVTRATLIPVVITEEEFEKGSAILHRDDPRMDRRCEIIRSKQQKKSSHLKRHLAKEINP